MSTGPGAEARGLVTRWSPGPDPAPESVGCGRLRGLSLTLSGGGPASWLEFTWPAGAYEAGEDPHAAEFTYYAWGQEYRHRYSSTEAADLWALAHSEPRPESSEEVGFPGT